MESMMNSYFDEFKDELLPHEELIWTEKVQETLTCGEHNKICIMLGFLLLVMISWEKGFMGMIIGLILLITIVLVFMENRGDTYYALTNYRFIIKSGSSKIKIESINIKILKKVKMEKYISGLGIIILEERDSSHGDFWNGDYGARQVVLPRLESIEKIEFVYEEILKIQGY